MTYYTWNHQSVTFNDSAPRLWSPSVIIFLPWFYHFKLVYFVLEKTQDIIATFPASATSDLQVWYTLQPVFRDHRQTSSHIAKLRCLNVLSVLSCEIWDVFFHFEPEFQVHCQKDENEKETGDLTECHHAYRSWVGLTYLGWKMTHSV